MRYWGAHPAACGLRRALAPRLLLLQPAAAAAAAAAAGSLGAIEDGDAVPRGAKDTADTVPQPPQQPLPGRNGGGGGGACLLVGDAGSGKRTLARDVAGALDPRCDIREVSLLSVVRSAHTWTDEALEATFRSALTRARELTPRHRAVLLLFRRLPDLLLGGAAASSSASSSTNGAVRGDLIATDADRATRVFIQCMARLDQAARLERLRIAVVATCSTIPTTLGSLQNCLTARVRACFAHEITVLNPTASTERAACVNRVLYLEQERLSSSRIGSVPPSPGSSNLHIRCHLPIPVVVRPEALAQVLPGSGITRGDLAAIGRATLVMLHAGGRSQQAPLPTEYDVLAVARDYVPAARRSHASQLANSPSASSSTAYAPPVEWDAIGGLHEAKRVLRESVVWSFTRRATFAYLGIKPAKGVLLYGPPGTGKTLVASAVAHEAGINFVAVSFTDLIRSAVGESERAIADMFAEARRNSPCVLFIDEIQAIFGDRNDTGSAGSNMVSQLLQEIDGLAAAARGSVQATRKKQRQQQPDEDESMSEHVIVLAATNLPQALDPALLRPGRLDRIVYVGLPDHPARLEIVQSVCARMGPCAAGILDEAPRIAKMTHGFTGADIAGLFQRAASLAIRRAVATEMASDSSGRSTVATTTPVVLLSADVDAVLRQGFAASVNADQLRALEMWAASRR